MAANFDDMHLSLAYDYESSQPVRGCTSQYKPNGAGEHGGHEHHEGDGEGSEEGSEGDVDAHPSRELTHRPGQRGTRGQACCLTFLNRPAVQLLLLVWLSVPQVLVLSTLMASFWLDWDVSCPNGFSFSRPQCTIPLNQPDARIFVLVSMAGLWLNLVLFAWLAGCWSREGATLVVYSVWAAFWLLLGAGRVVGEPDAHVVKRPFSSLGLVVLSVIFAVRIAELCRRPRALRKERRFVDVRNGFDLDLSYVHQRLIVMGWPVAVVGHGKFKNPLTEIKRFLAHWHPGQHKVYNLCTEKQYVGLFEKEFSCMQFPDHNPCPLAGILLVCKDIQHFLSGEAGNTAVLHCQTGRNRTGTIASAYLLHSRNCCTAAVALKRFENVRGYEGQHFSTPSQVRYVNLYEKVVKEGYCLRPPRWLCLTKLQVAGVPDWSFQILTHEEGKVFSASAERSQKGEGQAKRRTPPLLKEDVKIAVFQGDQKLFQFWFHTAYTPKPITGDLPPLEAAPATWCNPEAPQHLADGWVVKLTAAELDRALGPRGRKNHFEVEAFFVEETDLELWRGSGKGSLVVPQPSALPPGRGEAEDGREEVEDYDMLNSHTDLEVMSRSVYCGYLTLRQTRLSKGERVWCTLLPSGHLTIPSQEGVLTVDLASHQLQDVFRKDEDSSAARWHVKDMAHGVWETLACEAADAPDWKKVFDSTLRLVQAARDQDMSFCGFFWKLSESASSAEVVKARDFDFACWQIAPYMLQNDGTFFGYVWEDASDHHLCNVQAHPLERLDCRWSCMELIVPFQVMSADGPIALAGFPQHVDALFVRANVLRVGAPYSTMHASR